MNQKTKVLQISNIIFTVIMCFFFALITFLFVTIISEIVEYIKNSDDNTLGIGLAYALFIIFTVCEIIPLVLNIVIGYLGKKNDSKICRRCFWLSIIMLVLSIIFFVVLLIMTNYVGISVFH